MSLRALVKTAAAEALCRSRADRLWAPAAKRALVLGYHRVVEDYRWAATRSMAAMITSVRMLERQLDWVGRHFRFVSLDELGHLLESGATAGPPPAAVTFDDGYRDVYEYAFPLLQRKGIPAAVFVVTDLVGTTRLPLHDRLYLLLVRTLALPSSARARIAGLLRRLGLCVPALEDTGGGTLGQTFTAMRALVGTVPTAGLEQLMQALAQAVGPVEEQFPELRALDWEMVRDMHRAGFTIGSHTCSHALLTHEGPDRIRQELSASRRWIENRLGAPVQHFAYPDGRFDHVVVAEVATAGYRFAYTTCGHRDPDRPLLTIPRQLWWERSCLNAFGRPSPAIMSCQASGLLNLVGGCGQDHGCRPAASA